MAISRELTLSVFAVVAAFLQAEGHSCGTSTCTAFQYCCTLQSSGTTNINMCVLAPIPGGACSRPPFPQTRQILVPTASTSAPTTASTTTSTAASTAVVSSTASTVATYDPAVCGTKRCTNGEYCCYDDFFDEKDCHASRPFSTSFRKFTCNQVVLPSPAPGTTYNPTCGVFVCNNGEYCCRLNNTSISTCRTTLPSRPGFICKRVLFASFTFAPTTSTSQLPSSAVPSTTTDTITSDPKCGTQMCADGKFCCLDTSLSRSACYTFKPSNFAHLYKCKLVQRSYQPQSTTPSPGGSASTTSSPVSSFSSSSSSSSGSSLPSTSSSESSLSATSTSSSGGSFSFSISCGSTRCSSSQYCCTNDATFERSCFDTPPSVSTHTCGTFFPSLVNTALALSAGAIAGIVIGGIILLVLIIVAIVFSVRCILRGC